MGSNFKGVLTTLYSVLCLWCPVLKNIQVVSSEFHGKRNHYIGPCFYKSLIYLRSKAVDTIGNFQRLAFTVGVSQHMHEITNLWKFELNRSSKLWDNNERKIHPYHTKLCAFTCLISRPQVLNLRSRNRFVENYFSQNYVTSEGAVSHNVLYHQPLPITHHQESFYANNYFEELPLVSSAFKEQICHA